MSDDTVTITVPVEPLRQLERLGCGLLEGTLEDVARDAFDVGVRVMRDRMEHLLSRVGAVPVDVDGDAN